MSLLSDNLFQYTAESMDCNTDYEHNLHSDPFIQVFGTLGQPTLFYPDPLVLSSDFLPKEPWGDYWQLDWDSEFGSGLPTQRALDFESENHPPPESQIVGHGFGNFLNCNLNTATSTVASPSVGDTSPLSYHTINFQEAITIAGEMNGDVAKSKAKMLQDESKDREDIPAWKGLKTKAGLHRRRLPLACVACRQKKIRCSGEQPVCQTCSRLKRTCEYVPGNKRRKRRATSTSDMDESAAESATVTTPTPTPTPTPTQIPTQAQTQTADQPTDNTFDISEEIVFKGLQYDRDLLYQGRDMMPAEHVQKDLSDVFFEHIHGQPYCLLHKPSYFSQLKNNSIPPVLVLSVCAVAARFSSQSDQHSELAPHLRGQDWASRARDICLKWYDRPNLTIVICLLLLSIHDSGVGHTSRSWALGGQAIRMAYALRLHKDLEYEIDQHGQQVQLSLLEREYRTRVMWSCFLLDRFTSWETDRPMFIQEESIDLPPPVAEHIFEYKLPYIRHMPDYKSLYLQNLGVSAHMIKAITIWGRVVAYTRHPKSLQESHLIGLGLQNKQLIETLPDFLQWSRENAMLHLAKGNLSQYLLLHISIALTTVLICQSRAALIVQDERRDICLGSSIITAQAFAAASHISHILQEGADIGGFISSPFAGYCALSSASLQLAYLASAQPQMHALAAANYKVNLAYLERLSCHWGVFKRLIASL